MFNSVIASLLSTHKDSLTIRNICRRGNGINPCCTFIRAVLVRHARKLLPIVHGLGSNLVLLTVILAGIARSGKRQRLGRDLACGDGEVDRTAIDRQCGLAVQGNIAIRVSLSGLGIDDDGVARRIGVNGLAVFFRSCCTREFPLICTVFRGRSETIGGAVLKCHTGGQSVGHSTAVQTADDSFGDGRESVHQTLSVAGIVGVNLSLFGPSHRNLRGGNLVFQIVADRDVRVRRPPQNATGLIIVIRNLIAACTKADGVDRCALLQVCCGAFGGLESFLVTVRAIAFDLVFSSPNSDGGSKDIIIRSIFEIVCRFAIGKDNNVL